MNFISARLRKHYKSKVIFLFKILFITLHFLLKKHNSVSKVHRSFSNLWVLFTESAYYQEPLGRTWVERRTIREFNVTN